MLDEPPSTGGIIPRIKNWLFPNMQHKKLVGIAFYFLRYHWKKYSEVKVYAHNTPQCEEYYERIVALRSCWDDDDDTVIRSSIKEANKALTEVRSTTRSR